MWNNLSKCQKNKSISDNYFSIEITKLNIDWSGDMADP